DKKIFPRDKLCGGLLTLRSKKVFDRVFQTNWDKVICNTSKGVDFYYKSKFVNSISDYKDVYFTSRRYFDDFLLKLAHDEGATLILGHRVKSIDEKNKKLILNNEDQIRYNYLIGADGVNSVIARCLFGSSFDRKTIALGLETELPYTKHIETIPNPEIYFGVVSWGYAWVFPKKHTLTVGIGGLHYKNKNIKNKFFDFLSLRFGSRPDEKIKGHFIPFGHYKRIPGRRCILLAGDAAGLVEPITGEGIAFAMQSGFFAAKSILRAIEERTDNALTMYADMYKRITHILDYSNALKYLAFPKPMLYVFKAALLQSNHIAIKHMDLMADELTYQDFAKFLFRKTINGLSRVILPARKKFY
ncbi:MAG: tryptophan 7-halogenase, partial [Thermodesulfobacteriota bacterium]|nr:tryptophan 7-halogenase [Thermodesulfobacteriota bacterium]